MNAPLPDDLRPSTPGRLLRRGLRLLHTPPARVVLTLLALLALFLFLGAPNAVPFN